VVLVTVRVLPFFVLTVILICFVTLLVSTLGVRSYSAQRYSSMQVSITRHSSTISIERTAGCGGSSSGASGLNRDTSRSSVSLVGVESKSGNEASTMDASAVETLARPKPVAREPRSASSGSSRREVVARVTEAIATGPTSVLEIIAARAATRSQIAVALFSIPDHSKPPSLAAHHPAPVTIAHNSTSANFRPLPIARLPRSATPRHAAQPAHDKDRLSAGHRFLQGKKAGGNHFPKRCCRNATRAEGSKTTGLPRLGRLGSLGIVRMDFRFVGRAVVQRRSLQLLRLPEGDLAPFLAVPINRSPA